MLSISQKYSAGISDNFLGALELDLYRTGLFDILDTWTRRHLQLGYMDVASATPALLRQLVATLKVARFDYTSPTHCEVNQLIAVYDRFISNNAGIGPAATAERLKAFEVIGSFGGLTCPYCNFNGIENRTTKEIKTAQMDHFHSKRKYPILSMSFFNLVPSCGPCNLAKDETEFIFNPCDPARPIPKSEFSFSYVNGLQRGEFRFQVEFDPSRDLEINSRTIDILGYYRMKKNSVRFNRLADDLDAIPPSAFKDSFFQFGITDQALHSIERNFGFVLDEDQLIGIDMGKFYYDVILKFYNEIK